MMNMFVSTVAIAAVPSVAAPLNSPDVMIDDRAILARVEEITRLGRLRIYSSHRSLRASKAKRYTGWSVPTGAATTSRRSTATVTVGPGPVRPNPKLPQAPEPSIA
jgi:predicted component of type VI protein secretion system